MSALKISLTVALAFCVCALTLAQTAPPGAQKNPAVSSNLQIVSPKDGQKLSVNYVTVQFQVTNPAAAANNMPTFNVSLDGGDPVQTSTTSHTFTGLAPGEHAVTVQMVDANSLPVAGTLTQVRFVVASPQNAMPGGGSQSQQGTQSPTLREVSASVQEPGSASAPSNATAQGTTSSDATLPSTGSALPLLSVIGFGVLVGGIASALKTR